jgi:hypothetical protein
MSMRWRVLPIPVERAVAEGTVGEPFALDKEEGMVYTKVAVFVEDDEPKSSLRNASVE